MDCQEPDNEVRKNSLAKEQTQEVELKNSHFLYWPIYLCNIFY